MFKNRRQVAVVIVVIFLLTIIAYPLLYSPSQSDVDDNVINIEATD